MDLFVLSLDEAIRHEPRNRTYAIRVLSGFFSVPPLKHSPWYAYIKPYPVDDYEPESKLGNPLPDAVADAIITNFKQDGLSCDSLLIHCRQGRSRSPAVALALNKIFSLGRDECEFQSLFPEQNPFVYHTLIERAYVLGYKF